MAQLKDTVVSGNLRVTDTVLADVVQTDAIKTHSASGSDTINTGTDGQILKTNGTNTYWGSVTLDNVADGTTRKLSDYAPKASPALTGTPTAPTATAGTNTTQIATTAFVTSAVSTAVGSVYKVKGTKANYASLPSSGNVAGDVWNVTAAYNNYPAGTNWVWTGSEWDALGGEIDLSGKQDVLTFDSTPTANSTNPVTSGGIYNAISSNNVWEAGTGTGAIKTKSSSGTAGGNYSTVEGKGSVTGGTHTTYDLTPDTTDSSAGSYAHAEGRYTIACGKQGAHAEGDRTLANGAQSHAEGAMTVASGMYSHAEGGLTKATAGGAHSEGMYSIASGSYSHAEGEKTQALKKAAHSEGSRTIADGIYSHAEGWRSRSIGDDSHVEGQKSASIGAASHAEGVSIAYGRSSHSESGNNVVSVFPVGAAGATTYTSVFPSAEWNPVRNQVGDTIFCNVLKASIICPRTMGDSDITIVRVIDASLSGENITFTVEKTLSPDTALDGSVQYCITFSVSYGNESHSENSGNVSYGTSSHAEGLYDFAIGNESHVEGKNTISRNETEHAEGSFNVSNKASDTYGNVGNTQHSIGIGNSTTRKNALEIMQNGDTYLYGVGSYNGTNYSSADTVQTIINSKQASLVSGTNIKTVNNNSLLGSGNISIATPGTLNTNNTSAQAVNGSEALSGTVKLHKIAKTGTYSDLIGKPTVDSTPTQNSSNLVSSGGVYQAINNDSFVVSAALNDLNDRLIETNEKLVEADEKHFNKEDIVNYLSKSEYEIDEEVIAESLNDLNSRLENVYTKTETNAYFGDRVLSISSSSTDAEYPSAKCAYDEIHPAIVTTQPNDGFLPNVLYNLGTITGSKTFTLATPDDANVVNHYYWTFETGGTAPTITWPAGITGWYGGETPTIGKNAHYEVSILNGIAICMEV